MSTLRKVGQGGPPQTVSHTVRVGQASDAAAAQWRELENEGWSPPSRRHRSIGELSPITIGALSVIVFSLLGALVYSVTASNKLQEKQREIEAMHKAHEAKIEQLTKDHDAKVEQLTKEMLLKLKQIQDKTLEAEKRYLTTEAQLQKDLATAKHDLLEEKTKAHRLHRDNDLLHKQLKVKTLELKTLEEHANAFEKEMHTLTKTIKSMEGTPEEDPTAFDYDTLYKRQEEQQKRAKLRVSGQAVRDTGETAAVAA